MQDRDRKQQQEKSIINQLDFMYHNYYIKKNLFEKLQLHFKNITPGKRGEF